MTFKTSPLHRTTLACCLVLAGCSKSQRITAPDAGPESPARDGVTAQLSRAGVPAALQFTPGSTHPYFPLVPGTEFHYRSRTKDGIETQVVLVTDQINHIQGVATRVVEDIVRLDGEVIEHTFDWFAMDDQGNVWYFGEDATSIDPETGEVSHGGSWQSGQNGAQAGIIMEAHPQVGDTYNEENAPGVAEDKARVIALDARVKVPYDRFVDCLQTENSTPLEPDALENKFYAPGVGLVLEIDVVDKTRNVLVSVTGPGVGDDGKCSGKDKGKEKDKGPRGPGQMDAD